MEWGTINWGASRISFIEDKFRSIREIKGEYEKPRVILINGDGARTETCFIDSPVWIKRDDNIHCPDRLDNSISLDSALALREVRAANSIAFEAKIWAIIAAIIATIAVVLPIIS